MQVYISAPHVVRGDEQILTIFIPKVLDDLHIRYSLVAHEADYQLFVCHNTYLFDVLMNEFNILRERRKAGRGLTDIQPVIKFIEKINYQPQQEGHLTKDEVKYLTGEWFEEYVYYTLKEELQLSDEQICIGIHLDTDRKIKHPTNPPIVEEELKLDNELDVVFVKNDALHTIECKTSVWNVIDESKIVDGNIIVEKKKVSILGETIYKSDSLQQRFGLKPMTNIITLTRFSEDPQRFQKSLDRANLSGIKIINGDMLDGKNKLSELIK